MRGSTILAIEKLVAELPVIGRSIKYRDNGVHETSCQGLLVILEGKIFPRSIMIAEQASIVSRKKLRMHLTVIHCHEEYMCDK